MSVPKASASGVVMVIVAAMLWGTTGTAQSLAPSGLPAYWVGALRLAVAAVFFVAYAAWRDGQPSLRGLPLGWVLLSGACVAVYNLAFFAGVRLTGVAIGTAIAIGSGPIWAGLMQWGLAGSSPRPVWWLGTLLATGGGILMITGGSGDVQLSPAGIVLCLVSGLTYAAYALINKRLVASSAPHVVTLGVFGTGALIAMATCFAVSMLQGGGGSSPMPGPSGGAAASAMVVLYLGVVTTGIAYLLFSSALQRISGATAVALAMAEPVTAFALAIAVVGEQPAASAMAGLVLLLAGLAVVIRAEFLSPPTALSQ